jgi:outer membrane receptor for ferrienterochelin and colicins
MFADMAVLGFGKKHHRRKPRCRTLPIPLACLVAVLLSSLSAAKAGLSDSEDLTGLSIEALLNVEVISASRLAQKTSQSPSSASVLTAADIRTFGWRTLADALNGIRGLYITSDRNYSFLGVRGFIQPNDFNSRVLVMLDGLRMNENIWDTGNIGHEFMVDMDLIERIEFIPGSGSSIYGGNAFLGMINVVTKQGKALHGAQLSGEAGSFDTYKGRASYGKTFANGADVLVSASHFDSAGPENLYFPEFDSPTTNHGIAHNLDGERSERLFGRFQWDGFTLSSGFVDRFKRVPTISVGEAFNDPGSHAIDQQVFTHLNYEKKLQDKTTLLLKGFYQEYFYQGDFIYEQGQRAVYRDNTSGAWWGGEAQLTTQVFDRQRLIMGLEYQYDLRQLQKGYDISPYQLYYRDNLSGHRVELYFQDDIQLLDSLVLSAGLRFDYHHLIKSLPLNPRLGLIWNPLDSTTLKLLYSSTFRAPNAAESTYDYIIRPQEERINSYEGIVEWRSGTGIKWMGAFFHNEMSGIIEAGPASDWMLTNIGHYRVYGAEWEAEKRWESGRFLKASHTFNWLVDDSSQFNWGTGSPQNVFKIHYAEPLFDNRVKLGVEGIYIGDRKTVCRHIADAYGLVNVNLTTDKLIKGLDVSVGVYNLLDTRPQMLGDGGNFDVLKMNGREFRLKFWFDF